MACHKLSRNKTRKESVLQSNRQIPELVKETKEMTNGTTPRSRHLEKKLGQTNETHKGKNCHRRQPPSWRDDKTLNSSTRKPHTSPLPRPRWQDYRRLNAKRKHTRLPSLVLGTSRPFFFRLPDPSLIRASDLLRIRIRSSPTNNGQQARGKSTHDLSDAENENKNKNGNKSWTK